MLDLVLLARDSANTADRQDLLMAVLDDNEDLVQRVLDNNHRHEILLADDFFVPLIGICAAQGSRFIWRTLRGFGYTFQTPLRHSGHADQAPQMDVGGWAARILEPERLSWLMDEGLLDAFKPSTYGLRHSPAELGMLADDDLFDFWLGKWREHTQRQLDEVTPKQRASRMPRIPTVMDTLVGMGRVAGAGGEYPQGWPDPAQVKQRTDRLMDAFLEVHYGTANPQVQWEAFLDRRGAGQRSDTVVALCRHAAAKAPAPFKRNWLDWFMGEEKQDLVMVRGLLESGAPLATKSKRGLAGKLLGMVLKHHGDDINGAWGAWLARAKAEAPWTVDILPHWLRKPGLDYQGRAKQDPDGIRRLAAALSLSEHAGQAPSERARPRL